MKSYRVPVAAAIAVICLLFGTAANPDDDRLLKDLAGTALPGLEHVKVTDVAVGTNWFRGSVPALKLPTATADPTVAGFKTSKGYVVVISAETMDCSKLPSPFSDVKISELRWFHVPAGLATAEVEVPKEVQAIVGGARLSAASGDRIVAAAKVAGETLRAVKALGITPGNALPLAGTCAPALLTGATTHLAQAFYDNLDLTIELGSFSPTGTPAHVTFANLRLQLRGAREEGKNVVATTVLTDVKVELGDQTLTIEDVAIARNADKSVTLTGSTSIAAAMPTVPFVDLTFSKLTYTGTIPTAGQPVHTLTAAGKLGDTAIAATFTLPGSRAPKSEYTVALTGNFTLGALAGIDFPGLGSAKVSGVTISPVGLTCTVPWADRDWQVGGSRPEPGAPVAWSIGLANVKLSDLLPKLSGGHADGLSFPTGSLTYRQRPKGAAKTKPAGNIAAKTKGDGPESGWHLAGTCSLNGNLKALFSPFKLPDGGMPVSGFLPSGALSATSGALAKELVNAIDITLPVGTIAIDGMPSFVSFEDSTIRIFGEDGALAAQATANLKVPLGGNTSLTIPVRGAVFKKDGKVHLTLTGNSDYTWQPAGITWLSLTKPSISLVHGGDAAKCVVTWLTSLGDVADLPVTVTLTSAGQGKKPTVGITIPEGDVPLSALPLAGKLPAIERFTLSNLTIAVNLVAGTVKLANGNGEWQAALFLPAPNKPCLVVARDGLGIRDLIPALPDNDITRAMAFSRLILVATKDKLDCKFSDLPQPVRDVFGSGYAKSADKVTFAANALGLVGSLKRPTAGVIGGLLNSLSLPDDNLPLQGSIPADCLAAAGNTLAAALINAIDIRVNLGSKVLPEIPSFVSAGDVSLHVYGKEGFLCTAVESELKVTLTGGKKITIPTTVKNDANALTLTGSCAQSWDKPAGLTWLTLKDMSVELTVGGEAPGCKLGATTTVGSLKNLPVTVSLTGGGQGNAPIVTIAILGKDMPLDQLPLASGLPNADKLSIRDLTISSVALVGTVKLAGSDAAWTAAFFKHKSNPCLVIKRDSLGIRDVIPALPDNDLFKAIRFRKLALVLSKNGLNCDSADLPPAVSSVLTDVYGTLPNELDFAKGSIGMIAAFDPPSGRDPNIQAVQTFLKTLLGKPDSTVFAGQVAGVFGGGTPTLKLAAPIPKINLPDCLSFLDFPQDFTSSLFIDCAADHTDFGARIATTIKITTAKNHKIDLGAEAGFKMTTTGGLAIAVSGTTKTAWQNALGIQGLTLKAGTSVGIEGSAAAITIRVEARASVGSREIQLAGEAGLVAGAVVKGAIGGSIDELSLQDLVTLAGGIAPGTAEQAGLPTAKLTNVKLAFASPGSSITVGDETIANGALVNGELWFLMGDKPLGTAHGTINVDGIKLAGAIRDFAVGPVVMTGNLLDVAVGPKIAPHFVISGKTAIGSSALGIDLKANAGAIAFKIDQTITGGFAYSLAASLKVPQIKYPNTINFAELDLGVDGKLEVAALNSWLAGDGAAYIADLFKSLSKDIDKLKGDLDNAKKEVERLNTHINNRREQVNRERQDISAQLKGLKEQVATLQTKIDNLAKDIAAEQRKIKACNQTTSYKVTEVKSVIPWRTQSRTVTVADLVARAAQALENAVHAEKIADWSTQKVLTEGLRDGVNTTINGVNAGMNAIPVDMDPQIVALTTALETAKVALSAAQAAAQGIQEASKFAAVAMGALSDLSKQNQPRLVLDSVAIQGSAKQAFAGKPVVLTLKGKIDNSPFTQRLAFSTKDVNYNANQLQLLALFVAKSALHDARSATGSFPFGLQDLVDAAYNDKLATVEAEITKALVSNPTNTIEPIPDEVDTLAEITQADTDAQNDAELQELRRQETILRCEAWIARLQTIAKHRREDPRLAAMLAKAPPAVKVKLKAEEQILLAQIKRYEKEAAEARAKDIVPARTPTTGR